VQDSKDLRAAARTALLDCMALSEDESLLIVTDEPLREIGWAFFTAGKELCGDTSIVEITPRSGHGTEPPGTVAAAMAAADVVVMPTSTSFTHTAARRAASAAGSRVATMPGIQLETLLRCLNADYRKIAERTVEVSRLLTKASVARLSSAAGTDITIPIKGIEAISSTGLMRKQGQWGNLPSGESYLMPREGASEGVVVVDGSMAGIGLLEGGETITLLVDGGYVTGIEGKQAARKLETLLEPFGKPGRNLAELGVGTNHAAKVIGAILEDEKVMGTVHVALGNNVSMGGTVDVKVHLDGIILAPTLELDGKPLMIDGQLKL
jgi:leucyl aminopeptidase (aminopeptidase T)